MASSAQPRRLLSHSDSPQIMRASVVSSAPAHTVPACGPRACPRLRRVVPLVLLLGSLKYHWEVAPPTMKTLQGGEQGGEVRRRPGGSCRCH